MGVHADNRAAVGDHARQSLNWSRIQSRTITSFTPLRQLFADEPERLGAHLVDPPAGFQMSGELRVVETGLELLDQFGGTCDLDALRAHEFDGPGIHHRDIGNRAERRILHRHAVQPFQRAARVRRAVPASWNTCSFSPGSASIMPASIRCTRPRGSPVGGDQVIPAPGDMPRRMKSEHPVSQRIALVMIEEQPAVKLLAPQRFLNAEDVHAIRE